MTLPRTRDGHILGRLPAKVPDALKTFPAYLTSPLPAAPPAVKVPNATWNLDGNSVWGDCVVGGAGNGIAAAVAILAGAFGAKTAGTTDAIPTAAQAIAQYQTLTGAQTPGDANDTGLVIADFLKRWATKPGMFSDNVIGGYAPVAISSVAEIKQAIAAYGFVDVGVNLPQSAEDQVNAANGKMPVWTDIGDAPIGGHDILFVGYDATYLYAYTWGMVVAVTPQWAGAYVEEVWVVIPQEFVEAGKGPEVNLAELQADIGSLDVPVKPPAPPKKRKPPWWSWFGNILRPFRN